MSDTGMVVEAEVVPTGGDGPLVRCPGRHPNLRDRQCGEVLATAAFRGAAIVRCHRCKKFVRIQRR